MYTLLTYQVESINNYIFGFCKIYITPDARVDRPRFKKKYTRVPIAHNISSARISVYERLQRLKNNLFQFIQFVIHGKKGNISMYIIVIWFLNLPYKFNLLPKSRRRQFILDENSLYVNWRKNYLYISPPVAMLSWLFSYFNIRISNSSFQ